MEGDDDAGGRKVRAIHKQRTSLMTCVWDSPIARYPLTLPLVESIQFVGIITDTPLFGIQIPPLIKLLPQVIPVRIGRNEAAKSSFQLSESSWKGRVKQWPAAPNNSCSKGDARKGLEA